MNKKIILLFLIKLVFHTTIFAQKQIDTQTNAWLMYFGNHKLTNKISLHTEYQFRRSDVFADWQQSLARIGIDYAISDQALITGGYGWIVSYPYGKQPIVANVNEHRIFEQFILKNRVGRLYFNHRYRLEQRFIENVLVDSDEKRIVNGHKFRQRARYRLLLSIPITKSTMESNTLFASVYDEVFLGFGQGIGKNVMDQNRLYLSLGWKFNQNVNVQAGYLNHFVFKADGIHAERNHTLQVALTYNLDFRKD